jgi:bifunctional non-homologous end joining protein LigD
VTPTVDVTNPDKVLWPSLSITKREYVGYLASIADHMLPWLRERPLTLVRAPDGVEGERYYQKDTPKYAPAWIRTVTVPAPSARRDVAYTVCNDAATLAWLGNQAALEFHPAPVRRDRLERPDQLTVDIDPPDGAFDAAVEVALLVLEVTEDLGMATLVKTTGGKGLHVVVPLKRGPGWEETARFADEVARGIARAQPELYVAEMSKAKRRGRVFIDWLRNHRGSTSVAAYSTRAKPAAPVSTPLAWEELDSARTEDFTVATLPARLASRKADPWAGYTKARQRLTASRMKAAAAR